MDAERFATWLQQTDRRFARIERLTDRALRHHHGQAVFTLLRQIRHQTARAAAFRVAQPAPIRISAQDDPRTLDRLCMVQDTDGQQPAILFTLQAIDGWETVNGYLTDLYPGLRKALA